MSPIEIKTTLQDWPIKVECQDCQFEITIKNSCSPNNSSLFPKKIPPFHQAVQKALDHVLETRPKKEHTVIVSSPQKR